MAMVCISSAKICDGCMACIDEEFEDEFEDEFEELELLEEEEY